MSNCHICGKFVNRMREHLKNFHKWTKEEVKKYRMSMKEMDRSVDEEQRVAERRKINHEELILNEARGELINITITHFRAIFEGLQRMYSDLHHNASQTLMSLPSEKDVVEGRKDIGDAMGRTLQPSIGYLDKIINAEMIRIAHELHKLTY